MSSHFNAWLVLKDGRAFRGRGFGAEVDAPGEVVFNTSMTGYQEVLTDASYAGQIVTMTYPLMGNVGINTEDHEAEKPAIRGLVVRDLSEVYSNFRANESLPDFLVREGIPGIDGIDTRALTRHIRDQGAMMGIVARSGRSLDDLRKEAASLPSMEGTDLVKQVTCKESRLVENLDTSQFFTAPAGGPEANGEEKPLIAVLDFGIKLNILRCLLASGFGVRVFPAHASTEEILAVNPAGIFLSNGPGDPAAVDYAIKTVRELVPRKPIFGICLGHQILALALGGSTYKMKFGHHGANHPVQDKRTGKIEITSQNHGFAVDPDSLDPETIEITHLNLNDGTVEGLLGKDHPVFSVQYHPEACPGPHDALHHFVRFQSLIQNSQMGGR